MRPDPQLDAYLGLFESPQSSEPDVVERLSKQYAEISSIELDEAVKIAKAARAACFNAPSTYECATPSEAGKIFSEYLLSTVPKISNGLLQRLVFDTMRAWLY